MASPELKPFQKKSVKFGVDHKYVIYALEQGLGKSAVAIATCLALGYKALIICPAALKYKWALEIKKFAPGANISLFDSDRQFYRLWDTDFAIISYNFVGSAEILFEWADAVIGDEAHNLKEMKTKRTDAFHRLTYENSLKACFLLTGTPVQNRVYEFYSLLAICNYAPWKENSKFLKAFPTYVEFANTFSTLHEYEVKVTTKKGKTIMKPVQKWTGFKNGELLKKYTSDCMIRFESAEVLDLPPAQWIDVPVSYKNDPELERAFNVFTVEESGTSPTVKREAALAVAPFTAEYSQTFIDQELPVLIYSDHPEAAQIIAKKLGIPCITGDNTTAKKRTEICQDFQAGKYPAIAATIGALKEGQDLYRARDLIFNDPNWVPGNMSQVMFRIMRIGAVGQSRFHRVFGSYQQEYIYQTIESKLNDIKQFFQAVR